jgi:hypothetical protein
MQTKTLKRIPILVHPSDGGRKIYEVLRVKAGAKARMTLNLNSISESTRIFLNVKTYTSYFVLDRAQNAWRKGYVTRRQVKIVENWPHYYLNISRVLLLHPLLFHYHCHLTYFRTHSTHDTSARIWAVCFCQIESLSTLIIGPGTKSTKRAAPEEPTGRTTRPAKAPKIEKTDKPASKAKKGPSKKKVASRLLVASLLLNSQWTPQVPPVSQFKSKALPLHVTITHTPPTLKNDDETKTDNHAIGTLTLVPASFKTGSYGWKGSKHITVELQNDDADGEKEKVTVMLTWVVSSIQVNLSDVLRLSRSINATVMGSKDAEGAKEAAEGEADGHSEEEEEEPTEHSAAVEM